MNAKYSIALILALQVSMSLCDIPEPDKDLVDKYKNMKTTFYQRLLTAYDKVHEVAAPVIEKLGEGPQGTAAKELLEDIKDKPELQAIVKVGSGLVQEIGPLVDKARNTALGIYGHYVRPTFGQFLSDIIDNIKIHLDKFLPIH
ncbi:apolipoprotein A-II [Syngnathoides biaculeatus]|uniref:apolipoprotein A-II n=1 Tax=Syngnathoides biaculeatus TaxID=300417 RepID=UPI002ADD45D1|nr:apolipoprotein A-II [Syngnathoides biaculeatus]